MDNNKIYNVTNRSGSTVVYSIPEENIRREFTPKESKKITYGELEKLMNRPGGDVIISEYLLIKDVEAVTELEIPAEPEYFYGEEEIKKLLLTGTIDEFLDALDFAPEGVIEIIKDMAVTLPLNDVVKREAIKKKTGFDVSKAVQHNAEVQEASSEKAEAPKRRVQAQTTEAAPARRATPQYTIVTPE